MAGILQRGLLLLSVGLFLSVNSPIVEARPSQRNYSPDKISRAKHKRSSRKIKSVRKRLNQKRSYFLSFNEVKRLSTNQRNNYLRKVAEAMSLLQKEERIAQKKSFYSMSLDAILSFAFAEDRETLFCVGGGVPIQEGPTCGARSYCGYSCGAGEEICNPCIFGVDKDTQEPFCFTNATNKKCFAEIRVGYDSRTDVVFDLENRNDLTDIERAQIRAQFTEFQQTVESMCRGQIAVQERKHYIDEACDIIRRQTNVNRRRQNEEGNTLVTTLDIDIDENFQTVAAGASEENPSRDPASPVEVEQCDDATRNANRATTHDVFYLGDSHSAGSSRTDGRMTQAIISGLESRGHNIDFIAACGMGARTWASGSAQRYNCGGFSRYINGNFQYTGNVTDYPSVTNYYNPSHHDQVIINLGDNMFDWYRSGGRVHSRVNAAQVKRDVDALTRAMPGLNPCNCQWVGPTYHEFGRVWHKQDTHVDDMYEALAEALDGTCEIIDSRPMVNSPERGDGLHHYQRDASGVQYSYRWGEGIIDRLDFLQPPSVISPSAVPVRQEN